MECNMGGADRAIRIVVGLALMVAAFLHLIGVWGWIGIVPFATALVRFCPAYKLLGIRTCARQPASS